MDKDKLDKIIQNVKKKRQSPLNKYSEEIKYFLDNNISQKEIVKLLKKHFNITTSQPNLSNWIRKNDLIPKCNTKNTKSKNRTDKQNRKVINKNIINVKTEEIDGNKVSIADRMFKAVYKG